MSPQTVAIVMMTGMDLGLAPMQAIRGVAVINNRPSIYGDAMVGLLRSRGHKVEAWYSGEGADLVAHARVTRGDTGEVVEREFSMAEAKQAKLTGKPGPWTEYPRRMLQWRAVSWACRDAAADVLMGIPAYEEVIDLDPMPQHPPTPQTIAIQDGGTSTPPTAEPDPLTIPAAFDRRKNNDRPKPEPEPEATPEPEAKPAWILPPTDRIESFDDWIVGHIVPWLHGIDAANMPPEDDIINAIGAHERWGEEILDDWEAVVRQAMQPDA